MLDRRRRSRHRRAGRKRQPQRHDLPHRARLGERHGLRSRADPKYGDTVRFSATVEKLAGWEYPVVAVQCYQDVNRDGKVETNMFGPDIVYAAPLAGPDGSFALGGGTSTSLWASRGGGAATCRADLDAYGWTNKGQSIRVLDSTEFNVSA
jgi:hypothetical protein